MMKGVRYKNTQIYGWTLTLQVSPVLSVCRVAVSRHVNIRAWRLAFQTDDVLEFALSHLLVRSRIRSPTGSLLHVLTHSFAPSLARSLARSLALFLPRLRCCRFRRQLARSSLSFVDLVLVALSGPRSAATNRTADSWWLFLAHDWQTNRTAEGFQFTCC